MRDPLKKIRRVIAEGNWVAFDTETTDLGAHAELIELAIVSADGSTFESQVRPIAPVAAGAARVHQIDAASLERAAPFVELATEVRRRLTGRTVLAFNADFDRQVLWREFARAGKPAPRSRWLCLCDLMTEWRGRRHSLASALSELGIDNDLPLHRALADAKAVEALARALADQPADHT